jgi:hypothetical protein
MVKRVAIPLITEHHNNSARFCGPLALAPSRLGAAPCRVLAAKAAGIRFSAGFSQKTPYRAILRHAVRVGDGRCSIIRCVGGAHGEQRVLKA